MFYARVNKIKLLNNRNGFLELLNRARLQLYCRALNPTGASRMHGIRDCQNVPDTMGKMWVDYTQ
jgi:hypothetical protein